MDKVIAYKVTSLSNLKPNSLVALKVAGTSKFSLYVTDLQGAPYSLNIPSALAGVQQVTNTDGNLNITGTTNVVVNLDATLASLINSAVQVGDNISTLLNDAGYLTSLDIPTNTSEFINDGSDGTSTYVEHDELILKQDVLTDVNFGAFSDSLTEKTTIVDADNFNITDSADANKQKRFSFANLKIILLTFFNGLFAKVNLDSTTITGGIGVTINVIDNTKFDINVTGNIVNVTTFVSTPISVNLNGLTVTNILLQAESYVWIDINGIVVQSLTPPTLDSYNSILGYWVLIHSNNLNINVINDFAMFTNSIGTQMTQLLDFEGFRKKKGSNIVSKGTTGTRLTHSGGFAIKAGGGGYFTKSPLIELTGTIDSTFRMRNQNDSEGIDTQTLDVTNIDINNVTTALGNNKFGAHKVWKFASSIIRVQRGQKQYDNIEQALSGLDLDVYVDIPNGIKNGIHIGWIVFKKGTTWATGIDGLDYKFKDVSANGSVGGFIPNFMNIYSVSDLPQIITTAIRGAFQIQGGTGTNTDTIFEGKNNAGELTSWIKGDGTSSFNAGLSTGIITGGLLTINGGDNTKFDISAGIGYIVDITVHPQTTELVEWGSFVGVTLTNLGTSFATDIAIDVSGSVLQQNSYSREELRSVILLGGLDHSTQTEIVNVFDIQVPTYGVGSSLKDLTLALGDINLTGNIYTPNGVNMNIDKSTGTVFSLGRNNLINKKDPNTISQLASIATTFKYIHNNGSGSAIVGLGTTIIDPNKYDDGTGTLALVGNNRFSIQRILLFPNSNNTFIQYSEDTYITFKEALAAFPTATFTDLSGFKTALVRSYLIVGQGETNLTNSDVKFIIGAKFGGSGLGFSFTPNFQQVYDNSTPSEIVTNAINGALQIQGGTGVDTDTIFEGKNNAGTLTSWVKADGNSSFGGSTTLEELTDTEIVTPVDGQTLVYNAGTGKWENSTPAGGGAKENYIFEYAQPALPTTTNWQVSNYNTSQRDNIFRNNTATTYPTLNVDVGGHYIRATGNITKIVFKMLRRNPGSQIDFNLYVAKFVKIDGDLGFGTETIIANENIASTVLVTSEAIIKTLTLLSTEVTEGEHLYIAFRNNIGVAITFFNPQIIITTE